MSNRRRLQGRHFQDYVTSIHLSRSPLIDLIFVLSVALYAYRLSPFAFRLAFLSPESFPKYSAGH